MCFSYYTDCSSWYDTSFLCKHSGLPDDTEKLGTRLCGEIQKSWGGGFFFLVFFGTGHNRTRVYSASCETTMHRTYRNNTNSQRKPKLESFLMGRNSLFVRVYQILRFHYIFTTERFSTMCDGRVASGLSKQWFVDKAEILKHLRLKTAMIIRYWYYPWDCWKLFLNWCYHIAIVYRPFPI